VWRVGHRCEGSALGEGQVLSVVVLPRLYGRSGGVEVMGDAMVIGRRWAVDLCIEWSSIK